eukprot:g613.t1
MSSAPSSEAAGEPAPPPPRALKREPIQWEMHMEPSTGRAFYTNDAGATVDAVPEGDVVVGDLPFPDQAEPHAQLEVKSDEPPPEKQASGLGGQEKAMGAQDKSEETVSTGPGSKTSPSPRATKTKNKLQSQRMARVRRLSQRNMKANMEVKGAPVRATSPVGTKVSLPTRAAALKSISRKRRARRNSMMSQITSIIDRDEHDPQASAQISKTTSQVERRRIKNRRMSSTSLSVSDLRKANNKSKSAQTVHVFLLDGTAIAFNCTRNTKVRHAVLIICNTIGLRNDGDFGLYILKGGFATNDYTPLVDEEAFLLETLGEDWSELHEKASLLELEHGVVKAKHLAILPELCDEYLPEYVMENRVLAKYTKRVEKQWKSLIGKNAMDVEKAVLERCRYWFPWYGCTFFNVEFQPDIEASPEDGLVTDILMGVGHGGWYILRPALGKEKKVQPYILLTSCKYDDLDSWQLSKSGNVVSIVQKSGLVSLVICDDARVITDLITEYMFEYHQILEAFQDGNLSGKLIRSRGKDKDVDAVLAMQQRSQAAKDFATENDFGKISPRHTPNTEKVLAAVKHGLLTKLEKHD